MVEETIKELIGMRFRLKPADQAEPQVYRFLEQFSWADGYQFENPEKAYLPHCGLPIIKYGMLDLTLVNHAVSEHHRFLRIYMETKQAGPILYDQHPNWDYGKIVGNWRENFRKFANEYDFKIADACFSDSKHVWSEKYFYV